MLVDPLAVLSASDSLGDPCRFQELSIVVELQENDGTEHKDEEEMLNSRRLTLDRIRRMPNGDFG